ncbi:MAG: F0F1 ATP synthase subunit A [Candidatus Pacebacteria bacterium]|jgi:F-type H+-transporting ATPase subunit a|nr:F0F1 ATP synthase subunit A [Candidatus Paceibacterota bacterium]MBT3511702.1 F0F1 ATP synthase subunit A [Candidatus Paceibacterota bacterium]MBT4005131.1 F0F1 ATP synthase subunit A [Candidatus Paceibacterota bacterium]MBT4358588.1 F0F1 ATP synthase subunit A [Candidatus Paceibacterota bacterium]MBT4680728.1 F0F1 ATP synthase subunit A [Candidatus Paceibacterota bacterium]
MASLHISISAEPIFYFGELGFTSSMFVSLLTTILLSLVAYKFYKNKDKKTGFTLFVQAIVESLYGFAQTIAPQKAREFLPLFGSIFFFVIIASWAGLLPGFETIWVNNGRDFVPLLRGGTADLNITLGTAMVAVFMVQVFGYKNLGVKYFKKFINFSNPINFFVGFLELISEFAKIMSFSFRLFGNIFAGEVLLAVIAFLLPVFGPLPFIGLEIFVGFIQALVFATLTLVFVNIAVSSSH